MSAILPSNCSQKILNNYATTGVGTGAYVQLTAATVGRVKMAGICDSGGTPMILAIGPAGSEVDVLYIFPNQQLMVPFDVAEGTRLSVKSTSGTISSGVLVLNLYA